jgi:hypothetical protein
VADLGEVGITRPAAVTIATFFGNLDEEENVELEALPQPLPLPTPLPEPEPEPELEPPSGPMAGFDEAAVLAWLGTVPGLTAAQRTAAAGEMVEDEYDGYYLVAATAKTLRRLLKGTEAEVAVPALLAARDAHLAAVAAAEPEPAEAELAAAPGCQICFEAYGCARPSLTNIILKCLDARRARSRSLVFESRNPPAAGRSDWRCGASEGVVPRILVTCGHAFCEGCLSRMLRCAPHGQHFRQPAASKLQTIRGSAESNRGTACRR